MRSIYLFLILLFPLFAFKAGDYCPKVTKSELKTLLGDYMYDSSRQTEILFDPQGQFIEYEIKLFTTTDYLFLFDASNMASKVEVKLFKKKGKNNRIPVFSTKDQPKPEDNIYRYKASNQGGRMIVQYMIPEFTKEGCGLFVLGFKMAEVIEEDINIFKKKENQ